MQNIILLHGALGTSQDLQALAFALKNKGLSVYSFSFSGHGKTAYRKVFDVTQFTHELENFIIEQNLIQTSIFGYSLGGYVALNLAALQNISVKSIITLGTKFNWSNESLEKETKQLIPSLIKQKIPAFAGLLQEKHGDHWEDLIVKTAEMMRNINAMDYLDPVSIKKIEIPVLLGIADKDQIVSLEETVHVYKTLQYASMYMLPQTKHQIETVNTELLSQLIFNFLQPK